MLWCDSEGKTAHIYLYIISFCEAYFIQLVQLNVPHTKKTPQIQHKEKGQRKSQGNNQRNA